MTSAINPLRDIEQRFSEDGTKGLVTLRLSCGHLETRRILRAPDHRARCVMCGTSSRSKAAAETVKSRVPGVITGAELREKHHAIGPGITEEKTTMGREDDDGPALPEGYIMVPGLDGEIVLGPGGEQLTVEAAQQILANQVQEEEGLPSDGQVEIVIEGDLAGLDEDQVQEVIEASARSTRQHVARIREGEFAVPAGTQLMVAPTITPPTQWMDSDPAALREDLDRRQLNRDALMEWLADAMVEGVDYGRIHIKMKNSEGVKCTAGNQCTTAWHWSKQNLWKAGAEKICGMLGLRPTWPKLDEELASVKGGAKIITLRCELLDQHNQVQGDGIGARSLDDDSGNINKALKMAKKSSLIDATLVAGGLSEVFTQDLVGPDGGGDPDDNAPVPLDEYGQRLLKELAVKLFRHELEPEGQEGTASQEQLDELVESILQSLACRRFRKDNGDWRSIPAVRLQDAMRSLEEKASGELPVGEAK